MSPPPSSPNPSDPPVPSDPPDTARAATPDADVPVHQIGEVAETVGLSLRTIRYYEETGLVPPSGRSTGGFRLYTDDDVERLRLVKHMKPLDFSIEEMRDLLTTRDRVADPATSEGERPALRDRLTLFADLVDQRCRRLGEQLEAGRAFSRTLRAELADGYHDTRP